MCSDFEVIIESCITGVSLLPHIEEQWEYFSGIMRKMLKFLQQ